MNDRIKDVILAQSTAIRTGVLPEVRQLISSIKPDFDSVKTYHTNIKEWLKPVIDLSEYSVYPTNGITEGLNWWYNREKRAVWIKPGDYQWITTRMNGGPAIVYQSLPSSIDGNNVALHCKDPLALDLAYVGSTSPIHIKLHSKVDFVFYSLSKSFGIRNVRTGWIFTKTPDPALDALTHSAKYYNYFAVDVAERIIEQYDIGYVHNRLKYEQQRICDLLDLTPSDSVWLATSEHNDYAKFRRTNNTARICLSGVYNYES